MSIPSQIVSAGANVTLATAIVGVGEDDIVATGTDAATARQLTNTYNSVDTVAVGTGVKLPPTQAGMTIWIANSGANTMKVYPYEATTTINQNPSASLQKDHVSIFFAVTNALWYSIDGNKN